MTRGQAGFFIGFALAVLVWAAGLWVALGAALAGLIGWVVVYLLERDVDLEELNRVLTRRDDRQP